VRNSNVVLMLTAAIAMMASRSAAPADAAESVTIRADEIGKCGLKPEAVSRLLSLDADAFDQSFEGFRSLGLRQCYVDAALVIDLYLSENSGKLAPNAQNLMKFHAGQMYAHAGETLYSIAARRMNESTKDSSPSWQAYVAATKAFLHRDLPELRMQRGVLASLPDSPANKLNLSVVDRLIKYFEKPYAEAYSPQPLPFPGSPPN